MSFKDVRAALRARLAALPASPPVAWENDAYTPTEGTLYLRQTILPSASPNVDLESLVEHIGLMQVDVFAPAGGGSGAAEDMAATLEAHFAAQHTLIHGAEVVSIRTIEQLSGARDGAWYVLPIRISYQSFQTR